MSESKEIVVVDIDRLREHPANPNVMKAGVFNKLVRHIEKSGNYEPIVVRKHPEVGGEYQILNGHHRVKALRKLGFRSADCVVWDVDDEQTLVLLATLNRLGGRDRLDRKSELIKTLAKSMDVGEIVKALPETRKSIERLRTLESIRPVVLQKKSEELRPMVFFVNSEQSECVEGAIKKVIENWGGEKGFNKKGEALVEICRAFCL